MIDPVASIKVNVTSQTLIGYDLVGDEAVRYAVSTAVNGVGQQYGSECTPLGSHRVRAKIGTDQVVNTVFVGRRATGEIYSEQLALSHPDRDWILTRLLWLCGNEPGFNRGSNVDTQRRFIYIHGAPDSHNMGAPSSHGCIKMRNQDIISLYNLVEVGTSVMITD